MFSDLHNFHVKVDQVHFYGKIKPRSWNQPGFFDLQNPNRLKDVTKITRIISPGKYEYILFVPE